MIFNENGDIINEGKFLDRLKNLSGGCNTKAKLIYTQNRRQAEAEYQKTSSNYKESDKISLGDDEITKISKDLISAYNKLMKSKSKINSLISKLCKKYEIPEKFVEIDFNNQNDCLDLEYVKSNLYYFINNSIYEYFYAKCITIDDVRICKYFEENKSSTTIDRYDNPAVKIATELCDQLKSNLNLQNYYFDWEDDKPIIISLCCDIEKIIKSF